MARPDEYTTEVMWAVQKRLTIAYGDALKQIERVKELVRAFERKDFAMLRAMGVISRSEYKDLAEGFGQPVLPEHALSPEEEMQQIFGRRR